MPGGYAVALRCHLTQPWAPCLGSSGMRARRESGSPRKDPSWPPRAPPASPPTADSRQHSQPEQHSSASHLLREDPRAPRGPRPPRAADRQLRHPPRQREVEVAGRAGPGQRSRRRRRHVGARGDLRGDQPDRGLPGDDVPVVPGPPVRAAEVLHRGLQRARHHLLGAPVRHRRVHEQHHRRDQEPDRVHGRLPAHDRQGHLHHQRDRARRRVAARALAGRLLRQVRRQDLRQGRLRRPRSSRPAAPGSSSRSTSATRSASASTASASSR